MSFNAKSDFGTFRTLIWPIHRVEIRRLLPMAMMAFLICFNYSALRNLKDALLITSAGAEVIPFIKVWAILPMAVLVTLLYTKLSKKFSKEKVFHLMTTGFLICYALFAFVLYPFRDFLHPHGTADFLSGILPTGLKGMVEMFRYWTLAAFYVMSELWSTNIMSVLFWGFANEVTQLSEARRFYSVLGIASNFAAIAAGLLSNRVLQERVFNPYIPMGSNAWEQSMQMMVLLVVFSGLLAMGIMRWMNKNVLVDKVEVETPETPKPSKVSSFKESFAYISNSRYLLCIAMMVISYNLVICLVEVVWKDQVKSLYPSPGGYSNYTNDLLVIQGTVSTILALLMSYLIGRFGWTFTALITPIVMLITCVGFFGFLFFESHLGLIAAAWFGMSPLGVAVLFGAAQNTLSKATKYSVFDATKEMAFIPLDEESRFKGKAAIDGVGSRLGKSGGSIVHQGLLMFLATVGASAPYVAAILVLVIILWMISVRYLGKQFKPLRQESTGLVIAN